jgi:hypothetical protein
MKIGVSAPFELKLFASFFRRPLALPSAKHQLSVLDLVISDVHKPTMTAHITLPDPRSLVPLSVDDLRVLHTGIPENHEPQSRH